MFGTNQWLKDSVRNSFGIVTDFCKIPFTIKICEFNWGRPFSPDTKVHANSCAITAQKIHNQNGHWVKTANNGGSTKTQM